MAPGDGAQHGERGPGPARRGVLPGATRRALAPVGRPVHPVTAGSRAGVQQRMGTFLPRARRRGHAVAGRRLQGGRTRERAERAEGGERRGPRRGDDCGAAAGPGGPRDGGGCRVGAVRGCPSLGCGGPGPRSWTGRRRRSPGRRRSQTPLPRPQLDVTGPACHRRYPGRRGGPTSDTVPSRALHTGRASRRGASASSRTPARPSLVRTDSSWSTRQFRPGAD